MCHTHSGRPECYIGGDGHVTYWLWAVSRPLYEGCDAGTMRLACDGNAMAGFDPEIVGGG